MTAKDEVAEARHPASLRLCTAASRESWHGSERAWRSMSVSSARRQACSRKDVVVCPEHEHGFLASHPRAKPNKFLSIRCDSLECSESIFRCSRCYNLVNVSRRNRSAAEGAVYSRLASSKSTHARPRDSTSATWRRDPLDVQRPTSPSGVAAIWVKLG